MWEAKGPEDHIPAPALECECRPRGDPCGSPIVESPTLREITRVIESDALHDDKHYYRYHRCDIFNHRFPHKCFMTCVKI